LPVGTRSVVRLRSNALLSGLFSQTLNCLNLSINNIS